MERRFLPAPRRRVINSCVTSVCVGAILAATALAQNNQISPSTPPTAPTLRPMPNLPAGAGPQPGAPFDAIGAGAPPMPGMPAMPGAPAGVGPRGPGAFDATGAGAPTMPGAPAGIGARPMPPVPQMNQPSAQSTGGPPNSTATSLIASLDATAPFVQAFDFLLMLFCGIYCLRLSKSSGALKLMAVACFVSAMILLGFFLSASYHNHFLFPWAGVRLTAYAIARLLAPFELLLFAIAIVLVARRVR